MVKKIEGSKVMKLDTRSYFRHKFSRRCCCSAMLVSLAGACALVLLVIPALSAGWYDRRCLNEGENMAPTIFIDGTTKKELVMQFIEAYDIDLDTVVRGDPGELADSWMNCQQVHPDHCPQLGAVLKWLSTAPITGVVSGVDGKKHGNTQTGHSAKFMLTLDGKYKVLFKVKRKYSREDIVGDLFKMQLRGERHNAEIASYHLQRILGFNRAPIAVGRNVKILEEIIPVADDEIKKHFSFEDGKMCIKQIHINGLTREDATKKRSYLCSDNGYYEGVVMLWLPRPISNQAFRSPIKHDSKDIFLRDGLVYPIKNNIEKLLDYVDTLLFDYLIQNGDRYTFYFDESYYSSLLLLDNGKSFGDPFKDFKKFLDVFSGRCQIRLRTYTRLKHLSGGVLSEVLRHILSRDPIAPVLWDPHFEALDRRLVDILGSIDDCISVHGQEYVLRQ